jgi:hypothetical protein
MLWGKLPQIHGRATTFHVLVEQKHCCALLKEEPHSPIGPASRTTVVGTAFAKYIRVSYMATLWQNEIEDGLGWECATDMAAQYPCSSHILRLL